jgi:stress responsive alpha/beta barrel protein
MIREAGVKHVAVFWLKEGESRAEALHLIGQLGAIPHVVSIVAGGPVDHDWPALRIDRSWDVAFVASFREIAHCRAYFESPDHQRIASRLRDMSDRLFAIYVGY